MKRFSERLKALVAEYGAMGLVLWYIVFGCTFLVFALLIEVGLDWPWLESHVGESGTWVGAYVLTSLTKPVRFGVVAAALPVLARLRRRVVGEAPASEPAAE